MPRHVKKLLRDDAFTRHEAAQELRYQLTLVTRRRLTHIVAPHDAALPMTLKNFLYPIRSNWTIFARMSSWRTLWEF